MFGKALRAGLQSGAIMGIADLSTQLFVEGKQMTAPSSQETIPYDAARTLRWALIGLVLHGPYFLAGFSFLDKKFAPKSASAVVSWKTVAQKTVTGQLFLFPPFLVLLFGTLGFLEGDPDIPTKVQKRVPEAFASGCVYWPVANSINFKMVPSHLRVPYLALSSGVWNSYLSYTNGKGEIYR